MTMDTEQLQQLAQRTRRSKEAGIALLLSSCVLGLFLFIPLADQTKASSAPITIATSTPDSFTNIPLQAKAAIVYDLQTGQVLYAKNADAQLPLASLTKLLTVYAASKVFAPNTPITIPQDTAALDSPRGFSPGDTLAFSDLARLTLVASLNDGAAAIAETAAARENTSVSDLLASAATGAGLAQTYALNGNGLDVSTMISGGYGSAHDVALLAGDLVHDDPQIAFATTDQTAQATSAQGKMYNVNNTNPTTPYTTHLLLSKTGYTDLAGGNLALVFDAGIEHPVAVVVLGSTQDARFTDAQALIAATLAHFGGITTYD